MPRFGHPLRATPTQGNWESDQLCVKTEKAQRAAEELLKLVGYLAGLKHRRMKWMSPVVSPRKPEV